MGKGETEGGDGHEGKWREGKGVKLTSQVFLSMATAWYFLYYNKEILNSDLKKRNDKKR